MAAAEWRLIMFTRNDTREINIGGIKIGGGNPVLIQSMTNTKTHEIHATIEQILHLEDAGCQIVRVAVPDIHAADAIREIKKHIHIPLVADIHFDYRLAIACIHNGADKIRINPGNIGGEDNVKEVARLAKANSIPIRIGVNGGSLEKEILDKYQGATPEAIVESALGHIELLEKYDFENIVVSLKSSDVNDTIKANKLFAEKSDIPLHLGVTEAGSSFAGSIKSAVGIGSILSMGIGDTIRVSITGSPVNEIPVAKQILNSLKLAKKGVEIISCPTCGRCNVDLLKIADEIEKKVTNIKRDVTIAVMGCAVNGPGEARHADIGVACGKGEGLIFIKGEVIQKVPEYEIVPALLELLSGL